MSDPVVVNMRTCNPPWGQPGDVRIDRASKWGNPFPITDIDSRSDVLFRYAFYLRSQVESGGLDLQELKDAKRLGCWCKPKPCHGDIIKRALEDKIKEEQRTL